MEYIISANQASSNKIKRAFEQLGYDTSGWQFTTGIYLTFKGKIHNTNYGSLAHGLALQSSEYRELPLEEPLFKVGDTITSDDSCLVKITEIDFKNQQYGTINSDNDKGILLFKDQNLWRIYRYCQFSTGQPVLVRLSDDDEWTYMPFSHYTNSKGDCHFVAGNTAYPQCIPYEGNEYLVGSSNSE